MSRAVRQQARELGAETRRRPVDQAHARADRLVLRAFGAGPQARQDADSVSDRADRRIERYEEKPPLAGHDGLAVDDGDLAGPPGGARVVGDPYEGLADLVVGDDEAHRERSLRRQRAELALDAPGTAGWHAERERACIVLERRARCGATEVRAIVVG